MKLIQKLKTLVLAAAMIMPQIQASAADDVRIPENRVIYEVFVRNFSPAGNFAGVEAQIPRLKELGVDVIWLMPIYKLGDIGKWGTYSSPYAIKNYKEIDPDNGDAAQLHSLINTIHANGMEIWFDWVGNHTSKDNVWVSTHPEYYGNNFYSPNGWSDVYQLDVNNAAMHEAMIDAMQYWVTEFDIDGYRCDYASGPSEEFWRKATSRVLKNGKRIAWLAEDDSKPELVSKGYFDYNYAWYFHDRLLDFGRGGNVATLRQECLNLHNEAAYKGRSRMVYLSNHDVVQDKGGSEDKLFHKYLRPLTVLEFTVFGMPLLYNGQEIQYKSGKVSLAEKTTIDWSNPDTQMTSLIKTLCHLKHTQPALRTGSQNGSLTNLSTSNDNNIYVFKRTLQSENVVVMLNFSDSQQSFTVNSGLPSGTYTDVFSGRSVNFANPGTFTLSGQGYAVYINNDGGEIVPPEPETPHYVYVEDKTGWTSTYVYAYNESTGEIDDKAPFGSWPGTALSGSYSINGRTYKRAEIPQSMQGHDYSFIINCNDKQAEGRYTAVSGDVYFDDVTYSGDQPVDPDHYIYVEDKTEWAKTYVYAYNESTGETDSKAPFGAWPGIEVSGSYSINGRTYKRALMPASMQGKTYEFIINCNDKQVANRSTAVSGDVFFDDVTYSETVEPTVNYVWVEVKDGWNPQAVYAFNDARGETDNNNSAPLGKWPGTTLEGRWTIDGRTYLRAVLPESMQGKEYSFIINDKDKLQTADITTTVNGDVYLRDYTVPSANPTYHIYVVNNSGWETIALYGWYGGQAELFGGWPGATPDSQTMINGRMYDCYTVPTEANGKTYHIIVNNNRASNASDKYQYDFRDLTLNQDYYFTLGSHGEGSADKGYSLDNSSYYVFFHNTVAWNQIYVYAQTSSLTRAAAEEPFGAWPGTVAAQSLRCDDHNLNLLQIPSDANGKTIDLTVHNNAGTSYKKTVVISSDHYIDPRTTTAVEDVTVDSPASEPVYYDLSGMRVDNPQHGVYIEVCGSAARKVRF